MAMPGFDDPIPSKLKMTFSFDFGFLGNSWILSLAYFLAHFPIQQHADSRF